MANPIHPKVKASTTAGAAALLLTFFLHLPAEVSAAIVLLCSSGAGWLRSS